MSNQKPSEHTRKPDPAANGFHAFNLKPAVMDALTELGFETPTPVQAAVIPVLLEGRRNMVALAQTGTGKTAAFGVPLIHRIDPDRRTVQTVVLCPTRELCLQVCRDIKRFSKHVREIRTVAIYGGASIGMQIKAIENGVNLVVATPGRLHDLLRRGRIDLSGVACVVLDEADEMLRMGFEEDLNGIMAAIPDDVQKLLFSATMPRSLSSLVSAYVRDPVEITIGNRGAGADPVTHYCYMVHEKDRYAALKRIVDATPSMYGLVFCRTRAETQAVAAQLVKDGYHADALHGDLTQIQRDRVMQSFRDRNLTLLVATDVAARGLDINNLSHVINYQLPDDLDGYTHRSGRTGRAGKGGISLVLINLREKFKIKFIEKQLGKRFELKPIPSGLEVCAVRLRTYAARIREAVVPADALDPFMPEMMSLLESLSREELIRQICAMECQPLLAASAPDLNPESQSAVRRQPLSGDCVTLFVNAGRVDAFRAATLMMMLNREGGGRGSSVRIGKVDIREKVSFFEVSRADAGVVMALMEGQAFRGRALTVAPSRADARDSRPGVASSSAGRAGAGGQKRGARFADNGSKRSKTRKNPRASGRE